MKRYKFYIKDSFLGEDLEIRGVKTLDEAIDAVQYEWANSGKRTILMKEYQLISTKEHVVDTDY